MPDTVNRNLNKQVYNVHSGDTLSAQVARIICVLMPRGLLAAGFSERGDLLMIRYSDYKKSMPTWILDFYEHQFANEPLLAAAQKISAIFIATDKSFLVPEVLYETASSEKWMKKIHFVEGGEVINVHNMREDAANYMYAWPAAVKSLITRYFAKAKIYPFAAYQFYKPYKTESSLQCCITSEQVYATLYKDRKLFWHQIFNYQTADDIAYQIKLLCQQQAIESDKLNIQLSVTGKGLYPIIGELTQYFPDVRANSDNSIGTTDTDWGGTIHLLQQLYACAL